MAGKPKQGLDYSGWNVDIFENDTKIDELIDGQGWTGFAIYFYLCQKAYGSDGYFYRWSYANAATTARRMGGGIGSETVKQAVALCLRIGLFNDRLFAEEGVLTSRGIQRRYCDAIQKRSYKAVIREYWLLNSGESKGLLIVPLNKEATWPNNDSHPEHADVLPEDAHSLPENTPKSKVKESRVKESKGERGETARPGHPAGPELPAGADRPAAAPPARAHFSPPSVNDVKAYCEERGNGIDAQYFVDFNAASDWMRKGTRITDWRAAIRSWERNGVRNSADSHSPKSEREPANYDATFV